MNCADNNFPYRRRHAAVTNSKAMNRRRDAAGTKKFLNGLTGLCIALLLTSCQEQPQVAPTPPTGESICGLPVGETIESYLAKSKNASQPVSWPMTKTTDAGNFKISLSPASRIVRNQHFSLYITIIPTSNDEHSNKNPADIELLVNADMPAHRHGMNTQPTVTPINSNQYRVDGMLFHMQGHWQINVDIKKDSVTEQALFPVDVE